MDLWIVIAFVLFTVCAVMSALQRAVAVALIAAGLACWVLPAAWSAVH